LYLILLNVLKISSNFLNQHILKNDFLQQPYPTFKKIIFYENKQHSKCILVSIYFDHFAQYNIFITFTTRDSDPYYYANDVSIKELSKLFETPYGFFSGQFQLIIQIFYPWKELNLAKQLYNFCWKIRILGLYFFT